MDRRTFLRSTLIAAPAVLLTGPPKSWAARLFVRSNNQYLEVAQALATAEPFTMAVWTYRITADVPQGLMLLGVQGSANSYHLLFYENNNQPNVRTRADDGTIASTGTSPPALNTWVHVVGVWASSSLRQLYTQGVFRSDNTTALTVTGLNRTRIGETPFSTRFDGRLAWAALWNVALNASEIAALGTPGGAVPPYRIRPANLMGCVPLWGQQNPELDLAAARTWTFVGTGVPDPAPGPPVAPWWR